MSSQLTPSPPQTLSAALTRLLGASDDHQDRASTILAALGSRSGGRVCTRCQKLKSFDMFWIDLQKIDAAAPTCITCKSS